MEVTFGIISTILIVVALVALPFGLRARRRTLKQIAAQSLSLDKRSAELEERVKSFVKAAESLKLEEVAKPLEEVREPAPAPLRKIPVRVDRAFAAYLEAQKEVTKAYRESEPKEDLLLFAEGVKTQFTVPKVFPEEAFVSFAQEFAHIIGEREFFKIAKIDVPYGKVKIISKGRETGWHLPTSSRYLPIEEERAYVK